MSNGLEMVGIENLPPEVLEELFMVCVSRIRYLATKNDATTEVVAAFEHLAELITKEVASIKAEKEEQEEHKGENIISFPGSHTIH